MKNVKSTEMFLKIAMNIYLKYTNETELTRSLSLVMFTRMNDFWSRGL